MEINLYGEENDHGYILYRDCRSVFRFNLGAHEGMRASRRTQSGRKVMNWLYIISGLISVGLLVYLFVALLKPEIFE